MLIEDISPSAGGLRLRDQAITPRLIVPLFVASRRADTLFVRGIRAPRDRQKLNKYGISVSRGPVGAGLLNRYRGSTSIVSSNLIPSANSMT